MLTPQGDLGLKQVNINRTNPGLNIDLWGWLLGGLPGSEFPPSCWEGGALQRKEGHLLQARRQRSIAITIQWSGAALFYMEEGTEAQSRQEASSASRS